MPGRQIRSTANNGCVEFVDVDAANSTNLQKPIILALKGLIGEGAIAVLFTGTGKPESRLEEYIDIDTLEEPALMHDEIALIGSGRGSVALYVINNRNPKVRLRNEPDCQPSACPLPLVTYN